MPDKNHEGWPDRPAMQKRIEWLCIHDPQHIFNVINEVLDEKQKQACHEKWCPPPSDEELEAKYANLVREIKALSGGSGEWEKRLKEVRARLAKKANTTDEALSA